MYPQGARKIIDTRLRGNRPADAIVVSFVGKLPWDLPTVYATCTTPYDWRFLVGLPVIIAVKPGVEARDAIEAIYRHAQLYPTLADVERKQAASILELKPLRFWPFTTRHPVWQDLFA